MIGLFTSCFGEADGCGHYGYGGKRHGRRGVTKAMISPPSNFVPEKLKVLMSQVSAALDEESLFDSSDEPKKMPTAAGMGIAY
ncbi:hypothetical protein LPJ61_003142 [Coemansia biformis]|uniref:Uncharacterized protein n=1 Tax=Coemansia biformis TaxID=1286918 RepID=A0A9W7YD51_9FUNG|nr:hypothetical protein LPJ61_003142 [Coemansia biformis]